MTAVFEDQLRKLVAAIVAELAAREATAEAEPPAGVPNTVGEALARLSAEDLKHGSHRAFVPGFPPAAPVVDEPAVIAGNLGGPGVTT